MLEYFLTMNNKLHSFALAPTDKAPINAIFANQKPAFDYVSHLTFDRQVFSNQALYSPGTNTIASRVTALRNPISPASIPLSHANKSINEQLFDATSSIKILTSQVAMHLDTKFREKLFSQIDYLHEFDDWDPDDKPIQKASFVTFLRTILYIKPNRYPGLGLSYTGNLIAAWTMGKDRLTIEFLPNDQVKWVLAKHYDNGEVERSASQSSVLRMLKCLAPYNPEAWFF